MDQPEHRKEIHRHIHKVCWIVTGPDCQPQECRISDISDHGGKIACENVSQVPDKFVLFLTPDGKAARSCKVVWRSDKEIGLQFFGKINLRPTEITVLEA
jgi:hypothetical protein